MKRIYKYTGTLALAILAIPAFAQNAAETQKLDVIQIPKSLFEPVTYIWLMLGFILLVTIYALTRSVNALTMQLENQMNKVRGVEPSPEPMKEFVKKDSLWSQVMKAMTRSVPVEKEKDVMLDHNYDGIRELDNQLPPWWKYGFYLTIIFAVVYLTVYHVSGSAKLQLAEYKESIDQAEKARQERMQKNANYITEENVSKSSDPAIIAAGQGIFMKNCIACHGEKGEGKVGPNLTDEFWIHGGGVKNIFHTISEGVPAKGMISWKSQLAPMQIAQLSSFILSLQGTHPANGLDPAGDKWVEATTDTLKAPAVADTVKAIAAK